MDNDGTDTPGTLPARIAIVGATGNIGTALLRHLGLARRPRVVGIVRRTPPSQPPYDGVDWRSIDITAPDAVARLTDAFTDVDAVVHLAWGFQPSHDPDYLERLGVGGTQAVLAAADAAGVGHLVHMSSVGTYAKAAAGYSANESYSTVGVPRSPYSRHKAAAERLLDEYEAGPGAVRIARLRPGLVVQRAAGSALLRYGVPAFVPASILRWIPVLPLDGSLCVPMVHADDVAAAVVATLERRATGAFNLAAEPPIGRAEIADALGARPLPFPTVALRTLVDATWRTHVQPLDPGWIDLAFAVPLLDTTRARTELGWEPSVSATDALAELLGGMRDRESTVSPVLRRRSLVDQVKKLLASGPLTRRRRP